MTTVKFFVGIDLGVGPKNNDPETDDLLDATIPLFICWVGSNGVGHQIQKHFIFGFNWAEDDLEPAILEHIQSEFNVGGCHGWKRGYQSPDGGHFQILEYDFDEVDS